MCALNHLFTLLSAMADHNVVFVPYVAAPEAETLDGIVLSDPDVIERA